MNFFVDVVQAAPTQRRALITVAASGESQEWSFGELVERTEQMSSIFASSGVSRGDVVMTLIGSRVEWIIAMLACFRSGAVAFPCNEQLRAKDLKERMAIVSPSLIIADIRNRSELEQANPAAPVILTDELHFSSAPPPASLSPTDPALIVFTSGTSGKPKAVVHPQSYLGGQQLQARNWLDARQDDLVWCTAATGWSKSARNTFIAPWLCGATTLIHDARFDPTQRLELIEREGVTVLCMSPTEYRQIAKRTDLRPIPSLRRLVSAGETLNPWALEAWLEATGLIIADGYGQTETGHLTAPPRNQATPIGSMGKALPGIELCIKAGELTVNPTTVPTFFSGYFGDDGFGSQTETPWHTGDLVLADEQGFLFYEGRNDDLIISSGYRIGPTEVESALLTHPAVAEAAVIGRPDEERGEIVCAVVVIRTGFNPSETLAKELQTHVMSETAPYKYPRIVEFSLNLPKTESGKVRHAALRQQSTGIGQ